jgi:glycosyltransferase involved in cell wall biosynthesis
MIKNSKIKAIHIVHCSHSYFLGGNEKEYKNIVLNDWYAKTAKQIKKFHPEIEVECWAPEKNFKQESSFYDNGILFKFFPTNFSLAYALDFSSLMLKELKKEIEKSKREGYKLIIHLHEYHNLHGLTIATLFKNERIIAQHHGGSWPLKHLKQNKKFKFFSPFFILGQIWENLVLKNIKYFYALSQDEIAYLKKVAPKSNIRFQTMGIEEEYFKKVSKNLARKKLNFYPNKKYLIFLGRITSVKGIGYLLEAMKELNNKNIILNILGYGPEDEKFKTYIRENSLDNIHFLGGVFGDKKLLYLSASDCLILPSSKEGAPVVVMEAMARNLPSIATNVGGIPLMINNENGIIIKPKDKEEITNAIKKILLNPLKNIREHAKIYKWKKIIEDTIEDYKDGREI